MSIATRKIQHSSDLKRFYYADYPNVEAPFNNLILDSNNNIYIVGEATANDGGVCKLSSGLSTVYGSDVDFTSTQSYGFCALDTSENLIAATNGSDFVVSKFDSSGNESWSIQLTVASGQTTCQGIATDSADNIYVGINTTSNGAFVIKYNSSGVQQWQRSVSISGGASQSIVFMFVSSGDRVFAIMNDLSTFSESHVVEYNTSGVAQGVFYAITGLLRGMDEDSSGNFFFAGLGGLAIKTNSSGTVQFSKDYSGGFTRATVDPYDNIFFSDFGSQFTAPFIKVENDGTLIYERELKSVSGVAELYRGFDCDSVGNLYVCARSLGRLVLIKLPSNGTGTQTFKLSFNDSNACEYVSVSRTYSDTTLTGASGTMSSSNSSIVSAGSVSPTVSSFTVAFNKIFRF